MAKKKIAISACLLGHMCRYDGSDRKHKALLEKVKGYETVPFCPEDACFGTPRPPMDLYRIGGENRALCARTKEDKTDAVTAYAQRFFQAHPDIQCYIGKDKSPSCAVHSAKLFDLAGKEITREETGLMAKEAQRRGVAAYEPDDFLKGES